MLEKRLVSFGYGGNSCASGIIVANSGLILSAFHNFFNSNGKRTPEIVWIKDDDGKNWRNIHYNDRNVQEFFRDSEAIDFREDFIGAGKTDEQVEELSKQKRNEYEKTYERITDKLEILDLFLIRLENEEFDFPLLEIYKEKPKVGETVQILAYDSAMKKSLLKETKIIHVEDETASSPCNLVIEVDAFSGYSGGGIFKDGHLLAIITNLPNSTYLNSIQDNQVVNKVGRRLQGTLLYDQEILRHIENACRDDSPEELLTSKDAFMPDEKIRELVENKIANILNKLSMLKEQLEEGGHSAVALTKCHLIKAIEDILNPAVAQSMDKLEEDTRKTVKIWKGALRILGWLLLLALDHDWVRKHRDLLKSQPSLKLVVPAQSAAGIEIIFSGIRKTASVLESDDYGEAYGRDMIDCCPPEGGWLDEVLTIKQLVWRKVYQTPVDKIPLEFKDRENERLNMSIRLRNNKTYNYYLVVDGSEKSNPLHLADVHDKLKRDLPDLHVVFTSFSSEDNKRVFAIPESHIESVLIEFLKLKPQLE